MSKRGLGKGIDALLQGKDLEQLKSISPLINIPLNKLSPNPNQPRKSFSNESLQQLADSIKEKGVIQPIIAEGKEDGTYVIIAGERRFRAAQIAGLSEIPVLPKDFSEEEKLEIALIENIQREDLNPIEQAQAIKSLMETTGMNQDEIAKRLGISRSGLTNTLRLLKLPKNIQEALKLNKISSGHGRAILSVSDEREQQNLFKRILSDNFTVRTAEEEAGTTKKKQKAKKPAKKQKPGATVELKDYEQKLINHLGTKVIIKGNNRSGKIEISYFSEDDLERVISIIQGH